MIRFASEPDLAPMPSDRPAFHLAPLSGGDADALLAHFLRLDERSRRLRFGVPVNDAFLVSYVRRATHGPVRRGGLFEGAALRGVAELHLDPADPSSGEGALSLEAGYRRLGHGSRLFDALLFEAECAGVRRLELQCLRENAAMQRIARRFAARLSFDGSETKATIAIPPEPAVLASPEGGLAEAFRALAPVSRRALA